MTIYFHGGFGLHRPRMATILKRTLADPTLRDKALVKPLGFSPSFAARYRSWLHKTGLTELGYPIRLTTVGKTVWKNDPQLKKLSTQWLMHWELTRDPQRVETWHFFVREFLLQNESFTRDDLLHALSQKLQQQDKNRFAPRSKQVRVIARKLIDCYTQNYALGKLDIIRQEGKIFVQGEGRKQLHQWLTSPDQLKGLYR